MEILKDYKKMKKTIRSLTLLLTFAVCVISATGQTETPAQRDARMKWFDEARFGMFIHWGIYSVPAGIYHGTNVDGLGEWIQNTARIPSAEYRKYAEQFNPTNFSADTIVKLAKEAGMKYIVITAKHHDGFAMFKSSDPFNIVDATPFKRDVIRELADAARNQGLRFGVYYSQDQDWNHPGGGIQRADRWDPAMDGSFDEYLHAVAIPQVRELLTNIKPDIFWWDTPSDNMTPERTKPLHDLLALRPGIIVNDRLGGGFHGDTDTPEGYIPDTGYPDGRRWEVCMPMNETWGYKSADNNYTSAQQQIRNLVDIASKGGNYLLNIGPTATGEVPQPQVERLLTVGRWMKTNGESIYATAANPLPMAPSWGRITRKPGKLFLHVFDWPKDGKLSIGISNEIKKAYLLADAGTALKTTSNSSGVTIVLPATAPDPVDAVVVMEYTGDLQNKLV
jgi:alpha-L-fucosidase